VAVVGAAAAADDAEVGQRGRQRAVFAAQLAGVAAVEVLGFVELGVAAARGIGTDAGDPPDPLAACLELRREVTRVGAVDHQVLGGGAGLGVESLDRLAQRFAARQPPVGLDREGD